MTPAASSLRSPAFVTVIGMSLLVMIGFGLIVPALPAFALRFGVEEAGVGVVLFAFGLTRLFGDLFAGRAIDRFGERAITALGALIVGISSLAAGMARSYQQLVVFRGLGGIGSALFLGGLYAYVFAIAHENERGRAMGVFQGAFGLGLLVGPALGGLLMKVYDVNAPLLVYGVVCMVAAAVALLVMRHTDRREQTAVRPALEQIAPLLARRSYRAALAASAVAFLTISALQTLLPVQWVKVAGGTRATAGLPFTISALAALVVVWHAGALSDRRGRKFTLLPSLIAMTALTAALGFARSTSALVVLMAFQGFANAYGRPGPASIVADVAGPESRGLAISGHRLAGDVGAVLGPLMVGALAQYVAYPAAYLAVAACCAVTALLVARSEETAPALQPR